jgi:cysteine desulfurase
MHPLYFDYNATTPVHPLVFEAMLPWFKENFGNPGCAHAWGVIARKGLDRAREEVAQGIGAQPEEIIFTSGATESNNLALYGMFTTPEKQHLIISAIEHPAIMEPARDLEAHGARITIIPVDANGLVSPEDVLKACAKDTALISIMLANNEVGSIQPIREITALAKKRGIPVHTDAAQAVGKIPVNVNDLGVDLLSIAGHKIYAPKGIGALYVRKGIQIRARTLGGGQEAGIRPGTENLPYIVGLGAACTLARDVSREYRRQQGLGERFTRGLVALGHPFCIHGEKAPGLPGTMSVGFKNLNAGDIISGLVTYDVGVSAGAACHAGKEKVSSVLTAMQAPLEYARGTIRFSWGRMTHEKDIDELISRLQLVLSAL